MHLKSFFLFSLILVTSFGFGQDKRALFYLDQAERDFKQRKYPEALDNFERYFMRDSSKQLAYLRSGQIYESLKNTKKATELYQKAIVFDTTKITSAIPYMYLGKKALEQTQYHEAKKLLHIALEHTNKNAQAYQEIQKNIRKADLGIQAMANPLQITPERMPDIINAKEKQYFPVLTADGGTLVFTAVIPKKDSPNESEENIYISHKINNQWQNPIDISNRINTVFNEGTTTISADGKIMVFTSCEGRKSFGSCDLFITKKEGNEWSEPQNMGSLVNSKYWDSQPSLSPDGSKLFFSSDRPFGVGKKDLWYTELDKDGNWTRATNLGPHINTALDEVSPFIHANGVSLFYASNGREGLGGHDIFMTNISEGFASESFNLGFPINTPADESGLFISADGKHAFYSKQNQEKVEIYTFIVPRELSTRFQKTHYMKGYILDSKDKQPLYSSIEVVNSQNGNTVSKFLSDPITGDYMTILPNEGDYVIYIETPGYFFKSLKFNYKEGQQNQDLDIHLTKIEKQSKETLNNIFFDTGSAKLRVESDIELKKLLKMLEQNKDLKVEISGHTDNQGNDASNLILSNKRADAVKDYLTKNGILADRLIAKGYGESQPKAKNDTEQNRQLNRRIELKVL